MKKVSEWNAGLVCLIGFESDNRDPQPPQQILTRRNIQGLRTMVTGATSGIGRALAVELGQRRARILATGRREERLRELQSQLEQSGTECIVLAGDLTDRAFRSRLLAEAIERWGAFDALVNCAGVGAMGRFDEADESRLRKVFEINFFSVAELIRGAIEPLSRGNKPIIVNISSVLGHRAVPYKSEYCASKFAVHGLSDSIRSELKPKGIDVLLVSPSTTDSEFFDSALEDTIQREWKGRRPMSPKRVAKIAARAMRLGKSEVILTAGGKGLVWLDRLAPNLADYLITRFSN